MVKLLLSLAIAVLSVGTIHAQSSVIQSAHFDGTQSIQTSSAGIPFPDNSNPKMTIELWEKQEAFNINPQTLIFIPSYLMGGVPIIDIHIQDSVLHATYGNASYVTCPLLFDTNWHHIALVCDTSSGGADSISLYVDGLYRNNKINTHVFAGNSITEIFCIGTSTSFYSSPHDMFKGHICNVVITDSILYCASFIPNCMYDTTHIIAAIGGGYKCVFPTLYVAPLNSSTWIFNHVYDTSGAFYWYSPAGLPPTYTNQSPCLPVFTFSVDTTTYADSMIFYAINTNPSFNLGSYVYHTKNGWDTSLSVTPTQRLFTDTLTVYTSDTTLLYISDNGDTSSHWARKSTTSHEGVSNISLAEIIVYPVPASNRINIICQDFVSAEIVDLIGRTSMKSTEKNLSVKNIPAGNYLLKIKSLNGFVVKKIAIVH